MDDAVDGAGLWPAPSTTRSSASGPPPAEAGASGEVERPRRAAAVEFSARVVRGILARVAGGEALAAICAEPGMPHRATLYRWCATHPRFGARLAQARQAGGRLARSAQLSSYDPVVAFEICERMCEGETVAQICREPTMPSFSTVYRWRRTFPEFAQMMEQARQVQAERFCDLGWEIACEVTPDTAFATQVKLAQLRWTAGVMAPWSFRPKLVQPAGEPPQRELHMLIRNFEVETRADGAKRVVGYCPNPRTGQPERSSEGEWVLPPRPEGVARLGPPGSGEDDEQWL